MSWAGNSWFWQASISVHPWLRCWSVLWILRAMWQRWILRFMSRIRTGFPMHPVIDIDKYAGSSDDSSGSVEISTVVSLLLNDTNLPLVVEWCVCMRMVCVHACMHVCLCAAMCTRVHACCVCIHACMCVSLCVCAAVCICVHACVCVCASVYVYYCVRELVCWRVCG